MTKPKKTILYIEDDPASLRLIQRMLTHAGYEVFPATRGLDGIDLAREKLPDLILTDLKLPDITGYEIAITLRSEERFKETPIVALTGHSDSDYHDMAIAAGITGYLTKPINITQLLNQLSDVETLVAIKESTDLTRRVTEISLACRDRFLVRGRLRGRP